MLTGFGVALAMVVIAGWWYMRNLRLYGELTGLRTMVAVAGPREEAVTVWDLRDEWRGFWLSYWGVFGAFNILADRVVYRAYSVIFAVGLAALVVRVWRAARDRNWPALALPGLLLLQILVVFAGLTRSSTLVAFAGS